LSRSRELIIISSTDLCELILISYKEGMCQVFHKQKSLQNHLTTDVIRIQDRLTE